MQNKYSSFLSETQTSNGSSGTYSFLCHGDMLQYFAPAPPRPAPRSSSRDQSQQPPTTLAQGRVSQMVMPYCRWQKKRETECGTPANGSCQTHIAAWPCGTGRNRSVIFKRGQNRVSSFCKVVHTSLVHSKGHQQTRKMGKSEKTAGKWRKIANLNPPHGTHHTALLRTPPPPPHPAPPRPAPPRSTLHHSSVAAHRR